MSLQDPLYWRITDEVLSVAIEGMKHRAVHEAKAGKENIEKEHGEIL